jgi:cytochrome P450
VRDLADPTIDAVMSAYFGTPGPGGDAQLRWARDIFDHVFLNVSGKQAVRERALVAAEEMRPHLDAQIAHRRSRLEAGHAEPDDALTRLLRASIDGEGLRDIAIRHNLIGLIAGWIPTVSKAFTCAVAEILSRPEVLAGARAAARSTDHETIWRYLLEALRFRPQTWALLRTCTSDHTVAADTRRATRFHGGARVLIATQSAMFDERRITDPETFRIDRPLDSYLHFGHGLHTCFGLAINSVQLPAMAVALFEGPPITLPEPSRGIVYDRSYPASLTVEFSPSDA